jgi:DNA-binding GntR family transcriptional regulator
MGQSRLIILPNLENRTHINHTNIYEVIKKRDVDLAKKYIQEHIEHFYNILKKEIENNSCEKLK